MAGFCADGLDNFFHLDSKQPGSEEYLKFTQCSVMLVPDGGRVRSLRLGTRLLGAAGFAIIFVLALGVWGGQAWQGARKDVRIQALKNQLTAQQGGVNRKVGHMQARLEMQGRQLAVYARNIGNILSHCYYHNDYPLDALLDSGLKTGVRRIIRRVAGVIPWFRGGHIMLLRRE